MSFEVIEHVHEPEEFEPVIEYIAVIRPTFYRCATCGCQLFGIGEEEAQEYDRVLEAQQEERRR